uniref:TRAF3-interacting protein 1 N-terminal domain-containing protein n=1 Tax=Onchocerca volvulus TaxID=6282 RepID=A0A8R1TUB5_ONCVO
MSKMYTDRTKELFAGLIDRPLLTDQLLLRPPFRFLHDIVKITIQNTGFLMNNFTNEEMDVSTITDKTAKASFLKTLIKALNDDGSLKNVKVGKIIAGKEPEMTNLMLQKLAIDAAAYRDSKLKDTAKEEKQKKEKKAHKKEQNNTGVERKTNHNESRKVERDKRHSSKSKEKRKKESENKPMIIKQTVDNNKRKDSTDEGHFKDVAPETSPVKMEQMIHTDQEPAATTKTEDSVIVDNIINETEQPLVSPALREQPRLSTSSGRPRTSLSRLGTAAARPAPPKIKKKRVEEIERKPEILIIEEHGSLVRKILETKKGLEDQISKEAYNAAISVFDENDQAKSQQELADLQKTMQQITQTTHLFARFLDNAQEDAESMFKEMEDWRLESTKNLRDLQERKANAEGTSENLLLRLNQLDEQIKEVKNAIVQTKAKVIANEDKIRILVNNI